MIVADEGSQSDGAPNGDVNLDEVAGQVEGAASANTNFAEAPADFEPMIDSVATQPPVTEMPIPAEVPIVAEEPTIAEAFIALEEPAVVEEPLVAEASVATDEPAVAAEPIVTEASVATDEPADTSEPLVVESPVVAAEPIVVAEPAVTEEPIVEEPAVVEEPLVAEASVATDEPAVAAEPIVTEASIVVEEPAAAEKPSTGQTPATADGPVVTNGPTAPADVAPEAGKGDDSDTAAESAVPALPKKPTVRVLEGLVTAVSSDEVDLDLPDGRKAVIYRRNFGLNEEDPSTIVSVGDRAIGAELSREDPKQRVVMSRSWVLKKQNWEKLEASAADSKYVSGKVVSSNKNGLVVDVGVRAFVPASHIELDAVSDLKSYVGQVIEAKIIEINPGSERLVLSRRPVLLRAQRQKVKELLSSLKPGETRTGTVASLADYGVFVDLGGVKGLVHVSEISWERIGKPADAVSVGDEVEVKVLDLNVKKRRISLSMRQLTEDPLASIEVGTVQTGRVTRLVDFGAFVDLGVAEGLCHLSELAEYRVQAPEEVVTPGDQVPVKVLSVDKKRRRVALSVRQAAEFGG